MLKNPLDSMTVAITANGGYCLVCWGNRHSKVQQQNILKMKKDKKMIADSSSPSSGNTVVVCSCLSSEIILSTVRYIILSEYERLRELSHKYEGTKNQLKYEYKSRAVRDVKNMVNNYLKTKGAKI